MVFKGRFVDEAFVTLVTGVFDWKPQVTPLDVNKVEVAVGPEGLVADVTLKEARLWVLADDVMVQRILTECLVLTAGTLVGRDAVGATQVLGEFGLLPVVGVGAPLAGVAIDSRVCLPSVAAQLLGVAELEATQLTGLQRFTELCRSFLHFCSCLPWRALILHLHLHLHRALGSVWPPPAPLGCGNLGLSSGSPGSSLGWLCSGLLAAIIST